MERFLKALLGRELRYVFPRLWFTKGETLRIELHEILQDTTLELGDDAGLEKDGVEAELQKLIAARAPLQAGLPGEPVYGMTAEAGLPKGFVQGAAHA